jgi:hypothetical protein
MAGRRKGMLLTTRMMTTEKARTALPIAER